MACMENNCRNCKHEWFDNKVKTFCPKCGAPEILDGKRIIARFSDDVPYSEDEAVPEDD